MNRSQPGVRRGAHRTRREVTAALVPSLLAVVAVVALIAAVNIWRSQDPGDDQGAASSASTSTESPGSDPSGPSGTATSTASTASGGTAGARTVTVIVLNQSTQAGLAAVAAGRLRTQGWTVAATGNFRGTVPATTVYYPPGAEAAAQAAAESLPVTPRIRPRFGNLSTSRLTVVVTSDYPG